LKVEKMPANVSTEAETTDSAELAENGVAVSDEKAANDAEMSAPSTEVSQTVVVTPRRSARVLQKELMHADGEEKHPYGRLTAATARFYTSRFQTYRSPSKNQPVIRGSNDLPLDLRQNLKRMKNFLKLPKARRWVYYEFFYSDIDRELFLGPNEFQQCLQDYFPVVSTSRINDVEYRQIKRLIGKPRRLSPAFLFEEREMLDKKRQRIRDIQKGGAYVVGTDVQLPSKIPQPLTVGAKVFAKLNGNRDGIFAGTVDALVESGYRIIFEKPTVPAAIVPDVDVMADQPEDLVSVSFFLEKNKAAQPLPFRPNNLLSPTCTQLPVRNQDFNNEGRKGSLQASMMREDKCGNFPLRLITVMVKVSKFLDRKRTLVDRLRQKNESAERLHLEFGNYYQPDFQILYARLVNKLAKLNEQMESYLKLVAEYGSTLLPHLTEVTLTSRPETLRKFCLSRATQLVKQSITPGLDHSLDKGGVDLVISMCALLLQLRSLGQQQTLSAYDVRLVNKVLVEIKDHLEPKVRQNFEDSVEVAIRRVAMSLTNNQYCSGMPLTS
ncbi:Protein lin-9, partial [Trichinella patagoniensis]